MKITAKLLILVLLISCSTISKAQVFKVDTLVYNGDPANRINIVIMGDGYTINDTTKFRSDADSVITYFLNTPPYTAYKNFINFFGIEVISNQPGTDHPGTADGGQPFFPVSFADTYLSTTFDYAGIHRLLVSDSLAVVYTVANTNFPQYDMITILVNSPYYGGSGGTISVTSMDPSGFDVFMHEFGHSFGLLSDEYDYGSGFCQPGTVQGVNVSQQTDTSLLVWKNWLTTAPIPTPMDTACNLIGLYTGANYCDTNWYRPKCDCKMRSLFIPFCEVCSEQFIYKFSSIVNLNDNYSPLDTIVTLCNNQTQLFTVTQVKSEPNTIQTEWLVDGIAVVNNDTSYTFDASQFTMGNHQVMGVTYDSTNDVRRTLTAHQLVWNINIVNPNGLAFTTITDTLISPFTQSQWYIVGNPNPVSTTDTTVCTQSGNYYVTGAVNNGCTGISDTMFITCTTGLNNLIHEQQAIQVLPNPFTNIFSIYATGLGSSICTITLENLLGQFVAVKETTPVDGSIHSELNGSLLKKGIYFLTVNNQSKSYRKKIIKN